MTEKIIIAGSGGQGIMLLGKVIAEAAMRENKYVTWLPSYGAEVRGGAAYCMVVVSNQEIGSPYIQKADTLIIMNAPSYLRFKDRLNSKGLLIVNSSLVFLPARKGGQLLQHPFTDIAIKLGNIKVANMVALGCCLGRKKICKPETVIRTIEEIAPSGKKDLVKINKQALKKGLSLC